MPNTSPAYHLYFGLTGYKSKVSTTPSSGLIILPERLTEVRETFHSLGHPFIIKGDNSGAGSCKRGTGHVWGNGTASMPSPGTPLSTHFHVFTTRKFPEPRAFGVLWRLHYTGMTDLIIGCWRLIQPPCPLPSRDISGEAQSSQLLITWWGPLAISPHLLVPSRSDIINITKTPLWLSLLRKFQKF